MRDQLFICDIVGAFASLEMKGFVMIDNSLKTAKQLMDTDIALGF